MATLPTTLDQWDEMEADLAAMPPPAIHAIHRELAPRSLYYLMRMVLTTGAIRNEVTGQRQIAHPFVFDFINEAAEDSHNVIDIAARGHWKSTIGSFGMPIWRVLQNPNTAVCIFSVQRKLAKAHLSRIKQELEGNKSLQQAWPDVFYNNPNSSIHGSPLWSLESGLIVRRTSNRIEATLEAHAFAESLPTGKHYDILSFDDCVDGDYVRTAASREKLIEQHRLALNLTNRHPEIWYQGTYYHYADLYVHLEATVGLRVRKRPAVDASQPAPEGEWKTKTGRAIPYEAIGGAPVLLTPDELAEKVNSMGPRVYGQQMLCDPRAGEAQALDATLVKRYKTRPHEEARGKTLYLLVDPANQTKKDSDSTAMLVVGAGADRNLYLLDAVKAKLDPKQRISMAMMLHRKWQPLQTRWEETGLESDTFYLEEQMEKEGYRFDVVSLAWRVNKVQRLADFFQPILEDGRLWVPREILANRDGEEVNLVTEFVAEEIAKFPVSKEDHMLDAFGLLNHPKADPIVYPASGPRRAYLSFDGANDDNYSWMTA